MDEVQKLIRLLEEAETLLRSHGVISWAERLGRDATYLKAGDFRGVEDLLGAFGGMGSFNDLVVYHGNGHDIREADVAPVNERLGELRTAIYVAAKQLERESR